MTVPRVKLAYDRQVFDSGSRRAAQRCCQTQRNLARHTLESLNYPLLVPFYTVVHPARRNLTVIRAYSRLGGHPDDPQSDPQDRSWFGPHDRLFRQEESEPIDFKLPPPYVLSLIHI